MIQTPLADAIRPRTMDEIVGQEHLFGKSGVLRRMIGAGRLTNMIFYGPPGTGKTTAASVIAAASGMAFHKLNATTASLADVKAILAETGGMFGASGILLYLDEIQYFNRKQQQSLLEYMEDGRITLIASTTENPHFYVYNALISRSSLFEFKPVAPRACLPVLHRALDWLNSQNATSTTLPDDVGLLLAGGSRMPLSRGSTLPLLTPASATSATMYTTICWDASRSPFADLIRTRQRSMWQKCWRWGRCSLSAAACRLLPVRISGLPIRRRQPSCVPAVSRRVSWECRRRRFR